MVGVDAQQTPRSLATRSAVIDELLDIVERGNAKESIAILAGFSGLYGTGKSLASDLQPLIATEDLIETEVAVLAAGKGGQFAGSLPGLGRPAFSYLILGAMRGWADDNDDRQIDLGESLRFVNRIFL